MSQVLTDVQEKEPSAIQRMGDSIGGFFNSLGLRLVVIFVAGAMLSALAADVVYPHVSTGFANQLVVKLGEDADKKMPAGSQILEMLNQYDLSWYYITGADNKVLPQTKAFAPDLAKYDITPRQLTWKGKLYYEAVSRLGNGQILHIGVFAGQRLLPTLSSGSLIFVAALSAGYMGIVILMLLVLTILFLQLSVSKPLDMLSRACYSLLLARDAYSHITGGGINVPGAVSEVQNVSRGLKDIRRQYDEAIAAKAQKEEEIRKTRTEAKEEKAMLESQHQQELSQTQIRLTEMTTKGVEDEFISALGREIDSMKSSRMVAQRVLEKLNDKFPSSIIFGAFFKLKGNEAVMESCIGFDDASQLQLKAVDNLALTRQALQTGQALSIGPQALRDQGFQALSQANSLRNIIYFPLKFQNRDLGSLAIYFVQEGQTVQERMRVLRNAADLTSRSLHRVILYEEETEAARTDPLTGLRNKKFFYEIVPQIFQAASIKPEENPVSIIMIDGDHFKAVNDNYGHQVGDKMLKELAATIRQCIRTADSLERGTGPGDYLIRFGGEEFVVVMEKTDAQRAMPVAERIRQAVEAKSDWPGGITKWTISIGVATYPMDGKKPEEIMEKADVALYYVKEELGRNKVCHAEQVPRTFKAKKTAAAIAGELGVFDPAGLLQSIGTSQKTGVLTVQSQDGRQLWLLFQAGKPVQARMGKHVGNTAIVEFVVTYEEGTFNFQEMLQSATSAKLPKLEETFNLTKSLEGCLMNAALAKDHYDAARTIISTPKIRIRPIAQEQFNERWTALGQLEEPPTEDEFAAMTEIVKRADGKTTLEVIFKQLEAMPTHLMWRAAALMIQHGLIETKPEA
jgi:diguanylate cyclase (GGDEF)-like protein